MTSAVTRLVSLLREARLRSELDLHRIVAPAQRDVAYNSAILACAIHKLGKRQTDGTTTINVMVLKFASFLAARPSLLGDFHDWLDHRCQRDQLELQSWPLMPRGYLSDDTDTAAYLAAIGVLQRSGKDIVLSGDDGNILNQILAAIDSHGWFSREREILDWLCSIHLTQTMLGVA
jgi:hypothetical protein